MEGDMSFGADITAVAALWIRTAEESLLFVITVCILEAGSKEEVVMCNELVLFRIDGAGSNLTYLGVVET